MSCIFCRIVAGTAPASVVYQDDDVVAFMDIQPVNAGHVLVVPKRHAEGLAELDARVGGRLFQVAQRVAGALGAADVKREGVNLHLADGAAAGQEVFHVHLHVIPRYRGDGFGLRFGQGYGTQPPRAALDALAGQIRDRLSPGTAG
jgi:diadenosine tetraphosphate (Ap4A) HIT family hydrolase